MDRKVPIYLKEAFKKVFQQGEISGAMKSFVAMGSCHEKDSYMKTSQYSTNPKNASDNQKSSSKEDNMDKEELLIKHIERIANETASDNKATRQSMRDLEKRIDEKFTAVLQNTKDSEERTEKRIAASEERTEKRINDLVVEMRERDQRMETRVDNAMTELHETKRWIFTVGIAIIAVFIAVMVSVT